MIRIRRKPLTIIADKLDAKRAKQNKAVEQVTDNIIKEVERLRLEFDINGKRSHP